MRVTIEGSPCHVKQTCHQVLKFIEKGILRFQDECRKVSLLMEREGLPKKVCGIARAVLSGLPLMAVSLFCPLPLALGVACVGLGVYIATPESFNSRAWRVLIPMTSYGFASAEGLRALRCLALAASSFSISHLVLAGLHTASALYTAQWGIEEEVRLNRGFGLEQMSLNERFV
jgi:hypothetical protein